VVNQKMIDDVQSGKTGLEHAAILGCLLAKEIAEDYGIPAFIFQPLPVEWPPIAKVSGSPLVERMPAYHRENVEAVAKLAARDTSKETNRGTGPVDLPPENESSINVRLEIKKGGLFYWPEDYSNRSKSSTSFVRLKS